MSDIGYPKILTPKPSDNSWTHVGDLINHDRMVWKDAVIKEVFLQRDVEQILCIPLSTTGLIDKCIWRGTASGQFSVKSAYVIAKELVLARRANNISGQVSGMEEDEDMWKRVWYMRAPTKIKMFLWRCLHEIIPVNRVLTHRHMPVDPICPLCGLAEETPSHMLLNCVRASKVWVLSPLQLRPELMSSAQVTR